jgi:hypothetical protein
LAIPATHSYSFQSGPFTQLSAWPAVIVTGMRVKVWVRDGVKVGARGSVSSWVNVGEGCSGSADCPPSGVAVTTITFSWAAGAAVCRMQAPPRSAAPSKTINRTSLCVFMVRLLFFMNGC